jgi:adenosylcobinamide-phosphate guanylyltransferase
MKVPALIMAGGKGKRLGLKIEKPLLPFLGKPLVEWVIEAVKSAEKISRFYIVTSQQTLETEKKCMSDGYKVIRTNGKGYHDDLKQAILENGLCCPVLTIPADLPALTGEFLDKIVSTYEREGKDALAVFVPIEKREELGLSVSSTDEFEGVDYAVSGVNIINGAKMSVEKLKTSAIITEQIEASLNINTLRDLEIATKILQKHKKHKKDKSSD